MLAARGGSALAMRRTALSTLCFRRAINTQQARPTRPALLPVLSPSRVPVSRRLTFIRKASTSSSQFYQEDEDEARTRQPPKWFQRPVVLILAFMPIFTFGLGAWQIQRLQWKLELIDELESKLKKEPLDLPKNIE